MRFDELLNKLAELNISEYEVELTIIFIIIVIIVGSVIYIRKRPSKGSEWT